MPVIIALIDCGILVVLLALQLALLFGAPLGRFSWTGEDGVLLDHDRVKAIVASVVYVFAIVVILQAVKIVDVFPPLVDQVAIWLVAAGAFANFVASAASRGPMVRAVMTPISLVVAALTLFVAVTGHLVK
jgi:hypothetical protein